VLSNTLEGFASVWSWVYSDRTLDESACELLKEPGRDPVHKRNGIILLFFYKMISFHWETELRACSFSCPLVLSSKVLFEYVVWGGRSIAGQGIQSIKKYSFASASAILTSLRNNGVKYSCIALKLSYRQYQLYSVRGLERSELDGSLGCPGRLWDPFL